MSHKEDGTDGALKGTAQNPGGITIGKNFGGVCANVPGYGQILF